MSNSNTPKILYLDDEKINLQLFKIMFLGDLDVTIAITGDEALELLRNNTDFIAVISDMKMPGMNGLEFIEKAQAIQNNISYYILSGYDLSPEIKTFINNGTIKAYFQKPFDKKEILKKILSNFK